jgi:hypothetical protein
MVACTLAADQEAAQQLPTQERTAQHRLQQTELARTLEEKLHRFSEICMGLGGLRAQTPEAYTRDGVQISKSSLQD